MAHLVLVKKSHVTSTIGPVRPMVLVKCFERSDKGPSIKYVTLFLASFTPLSHFVTHPGTPRFLEGLVQKTRTKAPLYKFCLNCSRGFCPGVFCLEPLSGVVFVRSRSVRIHLLQRKLNITLNVMFRMYDKRFMCDVTCPLPPISLSQTVTPSRTPSPLERDVLYGRPQSHTCKMEI